MPIPQNQIFVPDGIAQMKNLLNQELHPQLNEPKGEILINENEKLIDDLSSAKPNPPKNTDKKRNQNHRNKNRITIVLSKESQEKIGRILREKDSRKGSILDQRIIAKRNSQNRNSRNNPENSQNSQGEKTSSNKSKSPGRTKENPRVKKSKLGSFISKIFGS